MDVLGIASGRPGGTSVDIEHDVEHRGGVLVARGASIHGFNVG